MSGKKMLIEGSDVVEMVVAELRQRREFLGRLCWPGRLVIHINPKSADRPVEIEVQIRV